MRKFFSSIGAVIACMACCAVTSFDVAATNALAHKSSMVQTGFMNYMEQCANQTTNAEMSLTAHVLLGCSQLAKFETAMDAQSLADAYLSATNTLHGIGVAEDKWQYWQLHLLLVSCLNSEDKPSEAYLIASNAWRAIQSSGFIDSTNCVSRALLNFEGMTDDSTVRDAVAVSLALTAHVLGHTNAVKTVKPCLPIRLRSRLTDFLEE